MYYRPTSLQKIIDVFAGNTQLTVAQISRISGLSSSLVHRYIKKLLEQNILQKIGSAPYSSYKLTQSIKKTSHNKQYQSLLSYTDREILDSIFLKFTPDGRAMTGSDGFEERCLQRNYTIQSSAKSYITIYKHLQGKRNKCGLLDATNAFKKHVSHMNLDKVYYADQYKWMEFGRGKLAEMTFYAKQSQSRLLITQSVNLYKKKIECLVKDSDVDAIAFVPASISRRYQLLSMMNHILSDIPLPRIRIDKYYRDLVRIPQKSLKTREQRLQNAQNTIYIYDNNLSKYKKILLIDDFVGSGSTLNETAKKLKNVGVKKIIGFAIVGNMDLQYDVINEV